MEIKNYSAYNEKEILKLYSSVGWTAYTDDPQALKQGFQNSLLVLAAYEREELLGIIRAVGDGVTIVFIQDLLVFPEKQRKGVGTALVKAVLKRYLTVRQIELTTDQSPETAAFYESLGFSKVCENWLSRIYEVLKRRKRKWRKLCVPYKR